MPDCEVVLPVVHADQLDMRVSAPCCPRNHALLDGLRHLLPKLSHEIADQLASPVTLHSVQALRAAHTGVPAHLFDDSPLHLEDRLIEQITHETVFAYLLSAVFCEAVRQSYGLVCNSILLVPCLPELAAYTWFVPSHGLRSRVDSLLTSCHLAPIPISLAGDIYERELPREERKAYGQYYTPVPLACHLLDQVGYIAGAGLEDIRLFDVATGCGVFLAQAARRLVVELYRRGRVLHEIYQSVEHNLHGYDVQPFAVLATKFHVLATVLDALPLSASEIRTALSVLRLPGVRVADTLAQPFAVAPAEAPHVVVGNPPYGTCRAGPHLDRYREITGGRANLYQLFLYFAVERCAPGGRIAFLMPESLRSGRYFTALRRYLATQTRLVATTDFHARSSLFPGVEQGVLIYACQKRVVDEAEITPPLVSVLQTANETVLARTRPFLVDHRWVQMDASVDYMLLKAGTDDVYALLYRLYQQPMPTPRITLGVHTGRFVWNRHRGAFQTGNRPSPFPVIYAHSVHRFAFAFPPPNNNAQRCHYLFAAETDETLRCTTRGQALLIQRTTAREQHQRLLATLLPYSFLQHYPRYLVENHVNYIDAATCHGEDVPLLYVLGLLNSRLCNFLFAALSGTTQVSAWELSSLPLVYAQQSPLEDLVARRLEARGNVANALEQRIDQVVYDLYRLEEAERALVDHFHAFRHSSTGRQLALQPEEREGHPSC